MVNIITGQQHIWFAPVSGDHCGAAVSSRPILCSALHQYYAPANLAPALSSSTNQCVSVGEEHWCSLLSNNVLLQSLFSARIIIYLCLTLSFVMLPAILPPIELFEEKICFVCTQCTMTSRGNLNQCTISVDRRVG